MSVDQLIEGYIGLYRERAPTPHRCLAGICGGLSEAAGSESSPACVVANNLYQKFDSLKKARQLRENQREIAAGAAGPGGATRLRVA